MLRAGRQCHSESIIQGIGPGAARRYAPRRWQFDSRRIYVRPRTGPQSAHLWWPAVAKLQAACVPLQADSVHKAAARLGQLRPGTDRRTDGSRYRLMPPPTAGAYKLPDQAVLQPPSIQLCLLVTAPLKFIIIIICFYTR